MNITKDDVKNFVDEPYFSRGNDYFKRRLVKIISLTPFQVKAHALGTSLYTVNLKFQRNELDGDCTCIAYEDFGPCKHIAAASLAVIQQNPEKGYTSSQKCSEAYEELEELKKYLSSKKKHEFIEMILKYANDDPEFKFNLEQEYKNDFDEDTY